MVRSTPFSKNTWATSQASGSWTPELWECHFTTTKDKVLVTLSLPGKVKWCSGQFLKVREVAASLDLTAKHMCIEASPFLRMNAIASALLRPQRTNIPCKHVCSVSVRRVSGPLQHHLPSVDEEAQTQKHCDIFFFLKVFIEFVTVLLLVFFWFFWWRHVGILAPQPGIEPAPLHWKAVS